MMTSDLTTGPGRLAAACDWFNLALPKVRLRRGEFLLTDELLSWAKANGVSLNWICGGGAQEVAEAFRHTWEHEQFWIDLLKRFEPVEQDMLVTAVLAYKRGKMSLEMALEGWAEAVEARRSAKVAKRQEALCKGRA